MTLEQRYETKQRLNELRHRVKVVDACLISEAHTTEIILEAMSAADFDKATEVIKKLNTLASTAPQLKITDAAIKAAITDINKYTGGGTLAQGWANIKAKFTGGQNPLVKALVLAQCLETGFAYIPKLITNMGLDKVQGKSIIDRLNAKSKTDKSKTDNVKTSKMPSPEKPQVDIDPNKLPGFNDLASNLTKAFSPIGIFGVFKKIPYVEGGAPALTREILRADVKTLQTCIKAMASGPTASELQTDLKDTLQANASAAKPNAAATTPNADNSGTDATTAGAAPTGTTPAAKATADTPNATQKPIDNIKHAMATELKLKYPSELANRLHVAPQALDSLLSLLMKIGLLK